MTRGRGGLTTKVHALVQTRLKPEPSYSNGEGITLPRRTAFIHTTVQQPLLLPDEGSSTLDSPDSDVKITEGW